MPDEQNGYDVADSVLLKGVADLGMEPVKPQEEYDLEVPEHFEIKDQATANWLVRKVVAARHYAEQVEQFAAIELQRAKREEERLLQRFGHQLEAWLRQTLHEQGGRRRSLRLPAGQVGLRAHPQRLAVINEQRLIQWAQKCLPVAIRAKLAVAGMDAIALLNWHSDHCPDARLEQAIAKTEILRHITDTGEVPPGAELVSSRDVLHMG